MADTLTEQVTVLARWQNQRLQIIETSGLAVPPHLAGFYVEWANERGFVQRQHLVEGSTYRVVGRVVRTEVRRFPDGWGARSGKPYSTYHVQARSAKRVKDKKCTQARSGFAGGMLADEDGGTRSSRRASARLCGT